MINRAKIRGAFKVRYELVEIPTALRPTVLCEKTIAGMRP